MRRLTERFWNAAGAMAPALVQRREKRRAELAHHGLLYEELVRQPGWALLEETISEMIEAQMRELVLAPPVAGKHDPLGLLREAQREGACGEIRGMREALDIARRVIAAAEELRLGRQAQEETRSDA
jgi:hypothetical protein